MTKRFNLAAAACVAALLASPSFAAHNVAGNPGFETAGSGGATDSDQWNEFAGGAAGTLSERDASMPASGSWAHRLIAVGDDGIGATAGINQNSFDVLGASLAPGSSVTASFDWKANLGPGGVAFGVLRILNSIGQIVGDTGLVLLGASGDYNNIVLPTLIVPAFGAAPNDSYSAFLEISVAAGAFAGSTAEGFVDNVVIEAQVVPIPAAAWLFGSALVGLFGFARRKLA